LPGDGGNCVAGDDPVTLPTCRGGCEGYNTAQRVPPKRVQAANGAGIAHADAGARVAEAVKVAAVATTVGLADAAGREPAAVIALVASGLVAVAGFLDSRGHRFAGRARKPQ
jgi:hypothetical protein